MIKRLFSAFSFAFAGIAYAFRSQFNMRIHSLIALLVIVAAFYFQINLAEWCIILFCISSVVAAELINTSLEYSIDLSTPHRNPKAGQAKDMAAAAVLVVSLVSAIIGCIIFLPRIF